jgi:hypothetical protein
LPIWAHTPFAPLCRAPVSSTVIQRAVSSPARRTSIASDRKPAPGIGQQPYHPRSGRGHALALGDRDPEIVKLSHQTRHRHLAAVNLR